MFNKLLLNTSPTTIEERLTWFQTRFHENYSKELNTTFTFKLRYIINPTKGQPIRFAYKDTPEESVTSVDNVFDAIEANNDTAIQLNLIKTELGNLICVFNKSSLTRKTNTVTKVHVIKSDSETLKLSNPWVYHELTGFFGFNDLAKKLYKKIDLTRYSIIDV